jgi:hypothetical protein
MAIDFARALGVINFIMRFFRYILFTYFISSSYIGLNQVLFERHYDIYYSQRFSNIFCKSNGNFILTGTCFPSPWERRPWILETDSLGNVLWQKNITEEHRFEIYSSTQIENSGYLLCGVQFPLNIFDPDTFYLYKTNLAGDSLWSRTYFGGYAYKAIEISNDTAIVVGCQYDKACALKINSNGDIIASSIYDELNLPSSVANSIIKLSDSLFLITGGIGNPDNCYLYYIFIDENLNKKWSAILTDYINVLGIETVNIDGYLLTLCQTSAESDSHPIVKADSMGNPIWARGVYYGQDCWPTYIMKYDNNSLFITGYKYQNQGGGALLIKIDSSATKLWQQNFGNQSESAFYSINKSLDNQLIIAGQDMPSAYLIKSDTSGSAVSTRELLFNPPNFKFFPNPFFDILNFESQGNKIDKIYLNNPLGELIEEYTSINSNTSTITVLSNYKGIVIIRIIYNNGFEDTFMALKL